MAFYPKDEGRDLRSKSGAAKGDTDKVNAARRASASGSPQGKLMDID